MAVQRCKVVGYGAWGSGFENWPDLQNIIKGQKAKDSMPASPRPEVIPANERRRSPLPVKLAVESSWQASQDAKVDPKDLSCVFVSGLGDTQLTDYMCKVLATEEKQLSPTKFHNSVHNAAAGYWTISTSCMKAANSVAAYNESVSLTLLESIIQCTTENTPVLMTFFDAPASAVLKSLLKNETPFAFSMIIVPDSSSIDGLKLEAQLIEEISNWPEFNSNSDELDQAYKNNPAAKILPLLKHIIYKESKHLTLPLSSATSIQLTLG